jgi:hypothetical protein
VPTKHSTTTFCVKLIPTQQNHHLVVKAEAVAVVEVQAEAEVEVQVDTVVKEAFTVVQLEDRLATENSLNLHTKVKAKEDHMATEPSVHQEILAIPTVLNARLTAHNAMEKDHHLVTVLNARLMVNANLTLEEIPVDAMEIVDLSAA